MSSIRPDTSVTLTIIVVPFPSAVATAAGCSGGGAHPIPARPATSSARARSVMGLLERVTICDHLCDALLDPRLAGRVRGRQLSVEAVDLRLRCLDLGGLLLPRIEHDLRPVRRPVADLGLRGERVGPVT